jgi:hypothetical protein
MALLAPRSVAFVLAHRAVKSQRMSCGVLIIRQNANPCYLRVCASRMSSQRTVCRALRIHA